MFLARIEKLFLFLTILLLPTQLGKHFWPEFSFVYSLPIDYLSPAIYFWDFLVLTLFILLIISGRHINRIALNLLYFFIFTQVLSLLSVSANPGAGLFRLEQYFISGLFGVYIASLEKPAFRIIFWGLIFSIGFESFLAITQFLKSKTIGLWFLGERTFTLSSPGIAKFDFYGREFLRPYGTFPHPNVMAGFMLVAIGFLSALGRGVVFKGLRGFIAIAVILGGITIALTVSRVAIFLSFIFIVMTFYRNKYRIFIVTAFIILLPVIFARFSSLLNYDNSSFIRREELSAIAINIFKNSPILGVGLNNFIPNASDSILSGPSRFLQPVHNIFLLSISETGLVGLFGLICFIGYPIFKISKLYPRPYTLKPIFFVWGIIIFLGMFDHYFLTLPQGYRILFFVWGITLGMLE